MAFEVARALDAPLDIFLVRKLGAPGHEELAMGAIASGGIVVIHEDVVKALKVSSDVLLDEVESERKELTRRETIYRGDRPALDVKGKTVILIDDGMATGSSMRAAVAALRRTRSSANRRRRSGRRGFDMLRDSSDCRRMCVRRRTGKLPRGRALVRRLCPDHRRRGLFYPEGALGTKKHTKRAKCAPQAMTFESEVLCRVVTRAELAANKLDREYASRCRSHRCRRAAWPAFAGVYG